ncbi:unnamed protein product [Vitrella brassicaformis CCMP3155]|uniref:Uncharacterized protein n=1 Tax=Vitrella brassicaformis (strain CCMP3155) TaxID=1169540 RepID=A0A0G4EXQ9_VITBC|nr:unnamed protein product [Vitrella brassicaformis CCMP3155]|eukprot:CEM03608.1 unnamed protein product [Vitrella brassicaformis CCMP3155]
MLSKYGKVLQQPSEMTPDLKEGIRNYFKPPTVCRSVTHCLTRSERSNSSSRRSESQGQPNYVHFWGLCFMAALHYYPRSPRRQHLNSRPDRQQPRLPVNRQQRVEPRYDCPHRRPPKLVQPFTAAAGQILQRLLLHVL